MFKAAVKALMGSCHKREARKLQPLIAEISEVHEGLSSLFDDELKAKTQEFRDRIGEATGGIRGEIEALREEKRLGPLSPLLLSDAPDLPTHSPDAPSTLPPTPQPSPRCAPLPQLPKLLRRLQVA